MVKSKLCRFCFKKISIKDQYDFCSYKCLCAIRDLVCEKNPQISCKECGKWFKNSSNKSLKYCSQKCRVKHLIMLRNQNEEKRV